MKWNEDKHISGEYLYNMQMPGSLNRLPVTRLLDGVLATLDTELDIDSYNQLVEYTKALLIKGSIIIVDGKVLDGSVVFIEKDDDVEIAYQLVYNTNNSKFLKVWYKNPVSTQIITYSADGLRLDRLVSLKEDISKATPIADIIIDSDGVIVVSNGQGILIPARATIERFANLMDTLAETTGDEALTWFVTNFVGSIDKLNAKSTSGNRFVPLPDGATISNASDSSFSNRLFAEIEMLLPIYYESTYSYNISPGESGVARLLGMMGYINKVKNIQIILEYIFIELGIDLQFNNSIWLDTQDKQSVV